MRQKALGLVPQQAALQAEEKTVRNKKMQNDMCSQMPARSLNCAD